MKESDFHKQSTLPGNLSAHADTPPIFSKESKKNISQETSIQKVPYKIGPYKIESLLDRGGMSILYLGSHPETKEPTAIKVLSPKYLENPDMVKQFFYEAQIIAMTDHPNIVKLFGQGEWEGGLYIAMEFIEGISLRQHLLRYPLSLKQALEITIDIAYALCHLHTHGVIHRDLKPENILMTKSGVIKLIDFGIAQLLTETNVENIPSQSLVGTPIYMSPEQREFPEKVSYPSDIYSLGIICYELIIGKLSHGRIHLALIPKGLQPILSKMLQLDLNDRYRDVVDLIGDLSSYMRTKSFINESLPTDQLSELASHLNVAEEQLLPKSIFPPPEISLGIAKHKGIIFSGLYYDFLITQEKDFILFCLESVNKGIETIIAAAIARGILKCLITQNISIHDLIPIFNSFLLNETLVQSFKCSFIVISPSKQMIGYILSKGVAAWHIHKDKIVSLENSNFYLSTPFETPPKFTTLPLIPDDKIVITSFSTQSEDDDQWVEDYLLNILNENRQLSPQKLVDHMVRQVRVSSSKLLQENSIFNLCLQINSQWTQSIDMGSRFPL